MGPLAWITIGAVGMAVLQLAVMGAVFLANEIRQAQLRRRRVAVMGVLEEQYRQQLPPPTAAPALPVATVHRAGMSDPPYFSGGVFSWLPRDRMN